MTDIQADLHCHSIEGSPRDAIYTVEELARFYMEVLGMEYMVLTNHCWLRDPSWLGRTAKSIVKTNIQYPINRADMALKLMTSVSFDFLLTTIVMPGKIDGLKFIDEVQTNSSLLLHKNII